MLEYLKDNHELGALKFKDFEIILYNQADPLLKSDYQNRKFNLITLF